MFGPHWPGQDWRCIAHRKKHRPYLDGIRKDNNMNVNMIYQCRLTDGEWFTIGWVEEAKAKVGIKMNIMQRWFDGTTTKVTVKARQFTIETVYLPPQPEDDS